MTRTAFVSVIGKENLPSMSVTVPVEVPFTTILTPIRGSFVLSTIVPVILESFSYRLRIRILGGLPDFEVMI